MWGFFCPFLDKGQSASQFDMPMLSTLLPGFKKNCEWIPNVSCFCSVFYLFIFYNIYRVHKLPILIWKIQNRTTVYLSMFKHKPLDVLNVFPSDRGLLGKIIKAKMCWFFFARQGLHYYSRKTWLWGTEVQYVQMVVLLCKFVSIIRKERIEKVFPKSILVHTQLYKIRTANKPTVSIPQWLVSICIYPEVSFVYNLPNIVNQDSHTFWPMIFNVCDYWLF